MSVNCLPRERSFTAGVQSGAAYARQSAEEAGLAGCFVAFLPKPQLMLDDQRPEQWRRLVVVHPNNCAGRTVVEYREALKSHKGRL